MATKDFKVKNGLQVTERLQVGGNTEITGNASVTGKLAVTNTSLFSSNVGITGELVVNNNVTLGNNSNQTLTVNARLAANLLPSTNNAVSLGSSDFRFKDLYLSSGTLVVGNVTVSDADGVFSINTNVAITGQILSVGANAIINSNAFIVGNTSVNTVITSNNLTLGGKITANGGVGSAGQFLRTGGSSTNAYFSDITLGTDTTGDYVATITAGNGLSGNATGEGNAVTIAVVANNGVISNSSGVFVKAGDAISVNSLGVHVVAGDGLGTNSTAVAVTAGDGIIANASGTFVKAGTGVTVNATGVHIGQPVETTSDVQFANVIATGTANVSYANVANNLDVRGTAVFGNNVTISGNLTVSGNLTYVNTTVLAISDNKITLNADLANNVAATETAGIEINRGSDPNTYFQYDETDNRWHFTNDGTNYYNVPISSEYNNYTYALNQPANTNTGIIRLTRNDNSNDDILIVGAGGTTVSSNGTHIEITSSSTANAIQTFAIEANATLTTDDLSIVADTVTDTVTFVAGYGVQVNTDSVNDKILISRKGFKNGTVSLITSGTEYTVDTATGLKSLKYLIHATDGTDHHASEVLVVAKTGDDAYLTEYAIVHTSASPLVTLAITLTSGNPVLKATPSVNSVTLKFQRMDLESINS